MRSKTPVNKTNPLLHVLQWYMYFEESGIKKCFLLYFNRQIIDYFHYTLHI